jgi:hypothetical protein
VVALFLAIALVVIVLAIKAKVAGGGSASNARLRGYGIVVDGNQIKSGGRIVGQLAGARAELTDGTSRHTLTRVVTVAGALTKKTSAAVIITCANGHFQQSKVTGAAEVRRAQQWVIRFNTMAAAPFTEPVAPSDQTPPTPSVGLNEGRSVPAPPPGEFGPEYDSKEIRIQRWRAERSGDST